MPYGPTKFVNGQNEGGRAGVMQANKGDIQVIAPAEFAEDKGGLPEAKVQLSAVDAAATLRRALSGA